MASGTKTKPKPITKDLREDFALGLAPLPTGQKRVDREKKIIYGVKMLGASSSNTHGVDGVSGTDYLYETVLRAVPLYAKLKANVDHPPRSSPNETRSAYDRPGKYLNVHAERCPTNPELGELFGDLKLLPSHKLTESLLDAAEDEQMSDCFSLSHNARGSGEVRNGRYVITNIPEARSVDVVADGGTTHSLFESKENTMSQPRTTTLGEIVLKESKLPASGKGMTKATLLEMDDLMATELPADATGDHKDDLVAAIGKLVKSDKPEDHAFAKKLLAMLQPAKAASLEESDETMSDDKSKDKDKDKPKAADMKESREESVLLLQTYGLKTEGPLLEALTTIPALKDKLAVLNEMKTQAPAKAGAKPPPGAPRGDGKTTTLQEGAKLPACDDLLSVQLN